MSYSEYMADRQSERETVKPVQTAAPVAEVKERKLSPESQRRLIAKLEKEITEKETELEDMRALRFEPEYYQDYQKMNQLDERIDDIHNELAHLYDEWEKLSS